jgi:hypothetical protein
VFIGEAQNAVSNTMDVAAGSQQAVEFSGEHHATIPAGTTLWSDQTGFAVEKEKSYLVTYLVAGAESRGVLDVWEDAVSPWLPTTFIIPGSSSPSIADASASVWSTRGDVMGTNCVLGVAGLFGSHPAQGTYASAIFDTHAETPDYNQITWDAAVPVGTDILLKVRTGAEPDMADAPAWEDIDPIPIYGLFDPGSGRYVQFEATLLSDGLGSQAPKLKDFTVSWRGGESVVDIGGDFTKGPDYGVFELTVDGREVLTGMTIDLEIFKDVRGHEGTKRLTSQLTAEIAPRNSRL